MHSEFAPKVLSLVLRHPNHDPAATNEQRSSEYAGFLGVGDSTHQHAAKSPRQIGRKMPGRQRCFNNGQPLELEEAADCGEKGGAFLTRLDQGHVEIRSSDLDRKAGKSGARAQVRNPGTRWKVFKDRQPGQRIQDMPGDQLPEISRSGQVDPTVPFLEFCEEPIELIQLNRGKNDPQLGRALLKEVKRLVRLHAGRSGGLERGG